MTSGPHTRPSLLLRLRDSRDHAAWCEFVELYGPVVFGFLRRRGVQDADAADLTQDVFRSVAGAIGRFDYAPARGGFRSWLLQVTRNHLHSFHRRGARIPRTNDTDFAERLDEQLADDGSECVWIDEWRREVLSRACQHVQSTVRLETWEAFVRTSVLGLEPAQVAAELGLTVSAVYLAKSRILARLRNFVAELESD